RSGSPGSHTEPTEWSPDDAKRATRRHADAELPPSGGRGDRPDLDSAVRGHRLGDPGGQRDRLVEVPGLEQVIPADDLGRLVERALGHRWLARRIRTNADGVRRRFQLVD